LYKKIVRLTLMKLTHCVSFQKNGEKVVQQFLPQVSSEREKYFFNARIGDILGRNVQNWDIKILS